MVSRPMEGVRVVEVAQYTFVPAAGAVLAEWGAEVIKVEHAEKGDAQRGLVSLGAVSAGGPFAPIMEHPNHNKRSIGIALEVPEGFGDPPSTSAGSRCVRHELPSRRPSTAPHRSRGHAQGESSGHLRTWHRALEYVVRTGRARATTGFPIGTGLAARSVVRHRTWKGSSRCLHQRTETRSGG